MQVHYWHFVTLASGAMLLTRSCLDAAALTAMESNSEAGWVETDDASVERAAGVAAKNSLGLERLFFIRHTVAHLD
jgi:hypothetical protein